MARLTEEMVIARSKQSDLSSIKKLNCWGAELGDVSLLRRMPNVEVLAFSINKIRSLQDFAGCRLLRELYVRKNEIRDLREIRHLRHLPALTSLWLDENPCTHHPQYRLTVLRNLPRLEKLDNVEVQQEELEEAQRRGSLIDSDDEGYPQTQEGYAESVRSADSARRTARARSCDSSPERDHYEYRDHRAGRLEQAQGSDSSEGAAPEPEPEPEPEPRAERADLQCPLSPSRRAPAPAPAFSPDHERLEHPAMTRSHYDPRWPREPPLRHSVSAHSVKEYASYGMNGDCRLGVSSPHEQYCERGDNRSEYLGSTAGREREREWERERERETARERERDAHSAPYATATYPSAVMAERRGFTRRPVARNSNLLSAVLCLVKELDYPSLEVAEMAVRCRMDELANGQ